MKIQILGSGCANCQNLEKNAREAASRLGIDAAFEKITSMDDIVEMGVLRTPGLAVDGVVQSTGKVRTVDEICTILSGLQGK
ncbi:MTH895/ArsE family thioredoxin-like protein [Spirochaeta dissipatitropha]